MQPVRADADLGAVAEFVAVGEARAGVPIHGGAVDAGEEALRGVTDNAARALGLYDRGLLTPGMRADIALWNTARPGDLAYPLGFNPLAAVIHHGELVRGIL